MKITAEGLNRKVYTHLIADTKLTQLGPGVEGIKFRMLSNTDPGISSGDYVLHFEMSREEAFQLFQVAMGLDQDKEIKKIRKELRELKRRLSEL